MKLPTCYFCLFCLIVAVKCARILVVLPTPSFSHNLIYRTIYKELASRGHDLVVFTPDPLKDHQLPNLKEIDLSYLYGLIPQGKFEHLLHFVRILVVYAFQQKLSEFVDDVLSHQQMKRFIEDVNEHFDLVLIEWNVNPSLAALSKRFNCPLIGLRSCGLRLEGHDAVGNPTTPSYIPIAYMDFENSFWGRLDNFLFGLIWRLHHHLITVPQAQNIVAKHFPNIRDNVLDLEKNVSLVLANTHPILTGVRPLVPAIIEIGGIHLGKEKSEMTKEVKDFLDNSTHGVVYVSLGTNVRSDRVAPRVLEAMLHSFYSLPYNVVWKFEMEKTIEFPRNVRSWKWLPQEAVLAHPNVKAFVTHGGLQSIEEAVDNLVPMVGIPFFADQHMNVRRLEEHGIGKRLNLLNLTEKAFVKAVLQVAIKPKYRENLKLIRQILHDQPIKPLEKAIWWIEHVIRHKGAKHIRYPGVDMNWFEYLLLDVVIVLLAYFGFILVIVYCTYRILFACIDKIIERRVKVKKN